MAHNKIPQGWAFTRCAACLGFALVRSGAKNIIKVSSAPAGEEVLRPDLYAMPDRIEASPKIQMQVQADGSVAAVAATTPTTAPQPVIRPAQRRRSTATTREDYAREAQDFAQAAALTERKANEQEARAVNLTEVANVLRGKMVPFPMPLPEPPLRNENLNLLPVVVGLVVALAVGSAFFHFL